VNLPSAVLGMNRRNVELVEALNPRYLRPYADDKILCKTMLAEAGVACPPTLTTCEGLYELPRLIDDLSELEDFVVKPSRGSGGDGIVVLGKRVGPMTWQKAGGSPLSAEDLHTHCAHVLFGAYSKGAMEDRILVEPRIVAHPTYHQLWTDGLCDVRVITVHAEPIVAMVRVPTASSEGRANLHQGGLGLAVNLQTGRVVRAVRHGRVLTHHPDSGAPVIGLDLPLWKETVDLAVRAAEAAPLGLLGVDIVVDVNQGPLVLEINARPGLEIQNVHGEGLGALIGGWSCS
jgi:alpha-L-glutamate ligase-like protein